MDNQNTAPLIPEDQNKGINLSTPLKEVAFTNDPAVNKAIAEAVQQSIAPKTSPDLTVATGNIKDVTVGDIMAKSIVDYPRVNDAIFSAAKDIDKAKAIETAMPEIQKNLIHTAQVNQAVIDNNGKISIATAEQVVKANNLTDGYDGPQPLTAKEKHEAWEEYRNFAPQQAEAQAKTEKQVVDYGVEKGLIPAVNTSELFEKANASQQQQNGQGIHM